MANVAYPLEETTPCWNITGWWFQPAEIYESQLGLLFPIYGKIKNVPNHQPDQISFFVVSSSTDVGNHHGNNGTFSQQEQSETCPPLNKYSSGHQSFEITLEIPIHEDIQKSIPMATNQLSSAGLSSKQPLEPAFSAALRTIPSTLRHLQRRNVSGALRGATDADAEIERFT